jgi:hypothetical protein
MCIKTPEIFRGAMKRGPTHSASRKGASTHFEQMLVQANIRFASS